MRLAPQNTLESVPTGYPATDAALRRMVDLVRQDYVKPRIRARARQLLAGLGLADFRGRLRAIWNFILDHITYLPNPVGAQHLTSPEELDRQIDENEAGEACASVCAYAAALLAAAGVQSYFAAIGWIEGQPRRFRHVALIAIDPRTRSLVWFDPVAAWAYAGFELGETLWRPGLPLQLRHTLTGEIESGAGPMNFRELAIGDIDAEQIARGALDATKSIANAFGPWGSLFTAGINAGEAAFQAATGRPLGQKDQPQPPTVTPGTPPNPARITPQTAAALREYMKLPPPTPPGMSTGAKVGLGLGAAALIALVAGRRRRREDRA